MITLPIDTWYDVVAYICWVASNILLAGAFISTAVFAIVYQILFDPSATTVGRLIRRHMIGISAMATLFFVGVFFNARDAGLWWEFPDRAAWWWPPLRLLVFGFVNFSIGSLIRVLWLRKYRPERLKTAPEESTLPVNPRHNTTK